MSCLVEKNGHNLVMPRWSKKGHIHSMPKKRRVIWTACRYKILMSLMSNMPSKTGAMLISCCNSKKSGPVNFILSQNVGLHIVVPKRLIPRSLQCHAKYNGGQQDCRANREIKWPHRCHGLYDILKDEKYFFWRNNAEFKNNVDYDIKCVFWCEHWNFIKFFEELEGKESLILNETGTLGPSNTNSHSQSLVTRRINAIIIVFIRILLSYPNLR